MHLRGRQQGLSMMIDDDDDDDGGRGCGGIVSCCSEAFVNVKVTDEYTSYSKKLVEFKN